MNLNKFLEEISVNGKVLPSKLQKVTKTLNEISYPLILIEAERYDQISKLYNESWDDYYVEGQLLLFSQYWLTREVDDNERKRLENLLIHSYGFHLDAFKYNTKTKEQRIVIGASLACAEINRLKRLS